MAPVIATGPATSKAALPHSTKPQNNTDEKFFQEKPVYGLYAKSKSIADKEAARVERLKKVRENALFNALETRAK